VLDLRKKPEWRPRRFGHTIELLERHHSYGGLANGHALTRFLRTSGAGCVGCRLVCYEAGEKISDRSRAGWRSQFGIRPVDVAAGEDACR
jgi:hypothetical protein